MYIWFSLSKLPYQLTDLQEVEENISFPLLRDGPLENLWGGGRSTLFGQGKIK